MAGKTFDLSVIFKVLDKASAPIKKVGRAIKGTAKETSDLKRVTPNVFTPLVNGTKRFSAQLRLLDKQLKKTSKRIDRSGFQRMGERMGEAGKNLSLKLSLPLAIMGGLATKKSIEFESAFTGVRKTVEATEQQFAELKKGLMGLALEIPIATTELFGIAEAAGQLGIKQKDILKFTKVMADLGATTNMSADEAATELARFANVVGVSSDDFDRLGSSIVDLGNNMAANEQEIVSMGGRLAKAGSFAGMSASEIMGFSAALTSIGINAEAGGTAFSQVMMKIGKEVGTGSKKMANFAAVAGKPVKVFEELWEKDAAEAILMFTEGLKRAEEGGHNVNIILDQLGMDGIRVASSLLGAAASGDTFRNALERSNKAWEDNNALTKEANLRYATTESRLKIAKNRVDQMAASFGDILKKALIAIIEYFDPVIKVLKDLGPIGKAIILTLAGIAFVIGPLLIILGFLATSFAAISTILASTAAPAILVIAAPIALIIVGITALIVIIIQLIRSWTDLKAELAANWAFLKRKWEETVAAFSKNPFQFLWDVVSFLTMGLIPKFEAFKNLIKSTLDMLPDFLKKKLGIEEVKPGTTTDVGLGVKKPLNKIYQEKIAQEDAAMTMDAAFPWLKQVGGIVQGGAQGLIKGERETNNSETLVKIEVTSDQGSSAVIKDVKKTKGKPMVETSLGYNGVY